MSCLEKTNYVFGPVSSRRLGLSLGIDVIPNKTCSYNCIYCQLNKASDLTNIRKEYVNPDYILAELEDKLGKLKQIDFITFSGSGEPTLNNSLGKIIIEIKNKYTLPVCVITNGSLLWMKDVQEDIKHADLVVPSLDAGTEKVFKEINRPDKNISFNQMVNGTIDFSHNYLGKIWLEVLFVEGVNDSNEEILSLKKWIDKIRVDKIQINTVVRPPIEKASKKISEDKLLYIKNIFGNKAEIISDIKIQDNNSKSQISNEDILTLISRHPCTLLDISHGLNSSIIDVKSLLEHLIQSNNIRSEIREGNIYYTNI